MGQRSGEKIHGVEMGVGHSVLRLWHSTFLLLSPVASEVGRVVYLALILLVVARPEARGQVK